jgi:hypothetical protein
MQTKPCAYTRQQDRKPLKPPIVALLVCLALLATAQAQTPTATTITYLPLVVVAAAIPTPTLPPPTFVNCATPPNAASAPNYPVTIVAINKAAETVTLQNVSASSVSLTGWTMCSILGGQTHPISGSLAPGESRVFTNLGGTIWNNFLPDPGALYTPDRRLASYKDT